VIILEGIHCFAFRKLQIKSL